MSNNIAYLADLLSKPKVFVSYHHAEDQAYADRFTALFHEQYDAVTDRSLERAIDSDNQDYIYQRIREEFITGTSCTIVLCGQQTMNRKHIDWEIKATLDKCHGLLGVNLPTNLANLNGSYVVPERLHDNIVSGFAHWIRWTERPQELLSAINVARQRAFEVSLIRNAAPMMARNR